MGVSKRHVLLLGLAALFLLAAELVRHMSLQAKTATAVGLVEVIGAITIGIAFGLVSAKEEK